MKKLLAELINDCGTFTIIGSVDIDRMPVDTSTPERLADYLIKNASKYGLKIERIK